MNKLISLLLVVTLLMGIPVLAQEAAEEEEELPECPVFEGSSTDVRTSYYMGEGLAYVSTGQSGLALQSFTCIILVVDPSYVPAHMSRAQTYIGRRQYEEAIEDYTRVIALDADLVAAYNNRGIAYAALGMYEEAAADFDATIARDADFIAGYNNRSVIHAVEGEFQAAIELLEQTIERTGIDAVLAEVTDPDREADAEWPEYDSINARAYALLGIMRSAEALEEFQNYLILRGNDGRIQSAAGALESRFTFEMRLDDGSWLLSAAYSPLGE